MVSGDGRSELSMLIDHTVLRPDASRTEVLRLCEEARHYGFLVVFVPPCYLRETVATLAGTPIRIGVPIGFPHGSQTTRTKVAEAVEAVGWGASVLDMVLNVGRLKSGDHDAVRADIAAVVTATPGIEHKVIIETCYLTRQEKVTACHLVMEAGGDYVKTSTGFGPAGATVEDVRLIKETVADRAKVKASGGIRDLKSVLELLSAGADRIGTSASVKIMQEWLAVQPTEQVRKR